jgi:NADH:ubiquinone oxidoreductase subunit B-like Fe-S oxidoreductase
MQEDQLSTHLSSGYKWASNSLVPYLWGEGCCQREFMLLYSGKYDIRRLGFLDPVSYPEDADILVVSQVVTSEMVASVKSYFHRMRSPKWLLVLGTNAISGGLLYGENIFHHWSEITDNLLLLPGTPPTPEQIISALLLLQQQIRVGVVDGA